MAAEASEFLDNQSTNTNSSLPREKWCGHEHLYKFHGFWFTDIYLKTTQKVLENFKPHPKDIILASFPKTGTTWLKALLHSIIHRPKPHENYHQNPLTSNHPHELIPSIESNIYVRDRPEPEEYQENGRILGTHIPFQILRDILNSSECKIVYVTRNPKDTLVSFWHFVQKSANIKNDPWELKAAVDQFCNGIVPFGDYYEHVIAYREESIKRPEKVFFVTYEELKENPKNHVRKMAEFLGCPFDEGDHDEIIEEIVKFCSFGNLSNLEVNKSSELPIEFPLPYNSFFRKGEVGDYKNYLDDEMIESIDGITREKFHANCFMYGI